MTRLQSSKCVEHQVEHTKQLVGAGGGGGRAPHAHSRHTHRHAHAPLDVDLDARLLRSSPRRAVCQARGVPCPWRVFLRCHTVTLAYMQCPVSDPSNYKRTPRYERVHAPYRVLSQ